SWDAGCIGISMPDLSLLLFTASRRTVLMPALSPRDGRRWRRGRVVLDRVHPGSLLVLVVVLRSPTPMSRLRQARRSRNRSSGGSSGRQGPAPSDAKARDPAGFGRSFDPSEPLCLGFRRPADHNMLCARQGLKLPAPTGQVNAFPATNRQIGELAGTPMDLP